MRGEYNSALKDIDAALKIDSEVAVAYKLRGDIFDELGDTVKAEENYRWCYKLAKKIRAQSPKNIWKKLTRKLTKKLRTPKLKKKILICKQRGRARTCARAFLFAKRKKVYLK